MSAIDRAKLEAELEAMRDHGFSYGTRHTADVLLKRIERGDFDQD